MGEGWTSRRNDRDEREQVIQEVCESKTKNTHIQETSSSPAYPQQCSFPIYASCVDMNQVWPMVLEKVYAKAQGSYENIAAPSPGTRFEHVLRDLTGGNPVRSKIERGMKSRDVDRLWKSIYEHSERRSNITAFARVEPVDGDFLRTCSEEEKDRAMWFKVGW